VSFEIRFEGNVRVNLFHIRREGIPNGIASIPKSTRGKSNVESSGEEIEGGKAKLM